MKKGEQIDILKWWKDHESTYPILSKFARDVLSIHVSTISSESSFSLSGRILEDRRQSLTPEMVECLTCLKDWELAFRHQQCQFPNDMDTTNFKILGSYRALGIGGSGQLSGSGSQCYPGMH